MRVLVACEFSGVVRDAFLEQGHSAWSCDLLPSEGKPWSHWYPEHYGPDDPRGMNQNHFQCNVLDIIPGGRVYHTMALEGQEVKWDLMIAHPPSTHLAVSGARWFKDKAKEQAEAMDFVRALLDAPIKRIALENPISIISSRIRKPDQIIQPWQFGHGETKATCLWLKNLPKLKPTNIVEGRENRVHRMPPGPNRWRERSRTFSGIAAAMADQWG